MATKVEILLAEVATKVDLFSEQQRALAAEIKENMATVEDVEMLRISTHKAQEQLESRILTAKTDLDKKLEELKKALHEEYMTKTTAKWVTVVALLILALALKVDLSNLLPMLFKTVVP